VLLKEEQAMPAVDAEEECQHEILEGRGEHEGPLPRRWAVSEENMQYWKEYGGPELEAAIMSGAIALLSAEYVVALAKLKGSVLQPRQALPDAVFLSLSQTQHIGAHRIVCISHCWLQPDHPDPHGHNLRVIARALEALLACLRAYLDYRSLPNVALFIDFCSMHQKCRGVDGKPGPRVQGFSDDEACTVGRFASEEEHFKQALGSLGTFYSHPYTLVWMLIAFPPDYYDLQRYGRHGNVAPYADRGWCFCEASWAAMVKSSNMVLDLGKARARRGKIGPS
jgi:hypothetical protein